MMGRDTSRRLRRLLWESGLFVNEAAMVPQDGGAACIDGTVLDRRSADGRLAIASKAAAEVLPVPQCAVALATVPIERVTPERLEHVVDDLGLIGPLQQQDDGS